MTNPMRLKEAAQKLALPVSTLRTERNKGTLDTFRLGNREYVTGEAIERMLQRCQERGKALTSVSRSKPGESPSGSSGTGQTISEALNAAHLIAKELRDSSKSTRHGNIVPIRTKRTRRLQRS